MALLTNFYNFYFKSKNNIVKQKFKLEKHKVFSHDVLSHMLREDQHFYKFEVGINHER